MSNKSKHGKHHPPANEKQGEGNKDRPEKLHITNEPLRIETDFSPHIIEKYDATNQESTTREQKKNRLEILALLGLFTYCCLTFWQGCLTRQSIKNNQENFTQESAPIIWVTPEPPTIAIDKPLQWNVHYKNYGHSTALNVHTCATAAHGPKGLTAWEEIKFPSAEECRKLPVISTGVAPPDFSEYTTVVGDRPLTAPQVSIINMTDGGALVFGLITYDDSAGHSYETSFCSYRLQTGALMHCEKYNYIKRTK